MIDHICAQHRHTLHHSHQVSNIIIELDGDRAGSESYVTAVLRVRRGEQLKQMTIWGGYAVRAKYPRHVLPAVRKTLVSTRRCTV